MYLMCEVLCDFSELLGKTISDIAIATDKDTIHIIMDNGDRYQLIHEQHCCETVEVYDVCGDLDDLIGVPLLLAEEVESEGNESNRPHEYVDSWTWTFYKLATIKGAVTIRWLGESNGYYSESVSTVKIPADKNWIKPG